MAGAGWEEDSLSDMRTRRSSRSIISYEKRTVYSHALPLSSLILLHGTTKPVKPAVAVHGRMFCLL